MPATPTIVDLTFTGPVVVTGSNGGFSLSLPCEDYSEIAGPALLRIHLSRREALAVARSLEDAIDGAS